MGLKTNRDSLKLSFLKGMWIYSLILWGYIVLDMFIFPQYQDLGISKYIPFPQNILADIAFPVSFLSFVAWDYLRKQEKVPSTSVKRS